MFSILKRKKPLEVRFFTQRDGLVDLFPPQPISQCIPEWWKKTPSLLESPPNQDPRHLFRPKKLNKSVKHCWSIQKTLELGIAFPLWEDNFITVDHNGTVHPMRPNGSPDARLGEQHPKRQYPGLLNDDLVNWKFNAEWMAYTEEPMNFYMTQPFYHMQDRSWECMPGVIEFYHQHNLNINTVLRKPKGTDEKPAAIQYEFNAGTVMNYFMPMMHDRKLIIKAEQVTKREWEKLHYGYRMFTNSASVHRKNNWGGCPFDIKGEK